LIGLAALKNISQERRNTWQIEVVKFDVGQIFLDIFDVVDLLVLNMSSCSAQAHQ
jgi:hypothetical protein